MSASSQLINLNPSPSQKRYFNGYSLLEGTLLQQVSSKERQSDPLFQRSSKSETFCGQQIQDRSSLALQGASKSSTYIPAEKSNFEEEVNSSDNSGFLKIQAPHQSTTLQGPSSFNINENMRKSLSSQIIAQPQKSMSLFEKSSPKNDNNSQPLKLENSVKKSFAENKKDDLTSTSIPAIQPTNNRTLNQPGIAIPSALSITESLGLSSQIAAIRQKAHTFALKEGINSKEGSCQNSAISNMSINSRTTTSQTFNHSSKFFELDQQLISSNQSSYSNQSQGRKRGRGGNCSANINRQAPSNSRIPDIFEWFSSLCIDDRVLCLTIVDDFFADSVQRMQHKVNRNKDGHFMLQQKVSKDPASVITQSKEISGFLQQEFVYMSMVAISKKYKDQLILSQKKIHEQEFLSYVRLTYTELEGQQSKLSPLKAKLNTISVFPALVQDPHKFEQLISNIVGSNFMKCPYEITYNDLTKWFSTQSPVWFDSKSYNSLAYWIIFYLEISLWTHYLAYIRGMFRSNSDSQQLNKSIFLSKENQYINIKNEMTGYWETVTKGLSKEEFDKFISNVLNEISRRIKHESIKTDNTSTETTKLSGCLNVTTQLPGTIASERLIFDNRLLEVLLKNQDASKFIQELCMVPVSRIEDIVIYQQHQVLVELMKEGKQLGSFKKFSQMLGSQTGLEASTTNSQSKKLKKKEKKKRQQQKKQNATGQVDINGQNHIQDNLELKHDTDQEEEKHPVHQDHDSEEEDEMYFDLQNKQSLDFLSNQQFITSRVSPRSDRKKSDYDEILQELLLEDIKSQIKEKPKQEKIIQPKRVSSFYERVQMDSEVIIDDALNEQQEEDQSISQYLHKSIVKEEHSSSCDSTDDQVEQVQAISEEKADSAISPQIELTEDKQEKSPQIQESIFIRKKKGDKAKKPKRMEIQSSEKRELSPVLPAFQIIRSQKPILMDRPESQQQQNKKKKKKRSKAVGPPKIVNTSNMLNNFMRSIVNLEDEEQYFEDQEGTTGTASEAEPKSNGKQLDEQNKVSKGGKTLYPLEETQQKEPKNAIVKQIYVKKGTIPKEEEKIIHQSTEAKIEEQWRKTQDSPIIDKIVPSGRFDRFFKSEDEHSKQKPQKAIESLKSVVSLDKTPLSLNSKKKPSPNSGNNKKRSTTTNNQKKQSISHIGQQTQSHFRQIAPSQPCQMMMPNQHPYPDALTYHIMNGLGISMDQTQLHHIPMESPYDYGYQQPVIENNLIESLLQQVLITNGFHQGQQEMSHEDATIGEESESYYSMLDKQMHSMVKEIERKLDSVRKERENAINVIESIVKETYKTFSSFVGIRWYGSMASGLAIEQSDVDLAVVGLDFQGNRDIQVKEMKKLCEQLDIFMKTKSSLKFIETATVPVIKLQIDLQKVSRKILRRQGSSSLGENGDATNQIDADMRILGIDITFEDSHQSSAFSYTRVNHGISCINQTRQLCMDFPTLKPIVLVLKKILQLHNLNQPYLGGLNSYSLVLMTSAFLNHIGGVDSMSKNLREFLNYYGSYFDPQTIAIEDLQLKRLPCLTDPMTVIDPLNKMNNVTRSAFRIRDIQEIFKQAFQFLIHQEDAFKRSQQSKAPSQESFDKVIALLTNGAVLQ